jgi:hypothetical protein
MDGKRKLWEDLVALKESMGSGLWCVAGDFNVVSNIKGPA